MNTENLSTLVIHKLTQDQYNRVVEEGEIDENALYLTPDEVEIPQSDWNQNDETAQDYIKNKPVVFVGSDTLTWDGNTDGLETFDKYFKVSDIPMSVDGLGNTAEIVLMRTDQSVSNSIESIISVDSDFVSDQYQYFMSVGEDSSEEAGVPVGIYLCYEKNNIEDYYVSSITIPGYTGFPQEKIAPSHLYQPDWNQNDESAPDYVKNRPFYMSKGDVIELIPETTIVLELSGESSVATCQMVNLIEGDIYSVILDGVLYEDMICSRIDDSGLELYYISNVNNPYTTLMSGEFVYMEIPQYGVAQFGMASGEAGEHTYSLLQHSTIVQTIDPIYLPIDQPSWLENNAKSKRYISNRPFYENDYIMFETNINNRITIKEKSYIVSSSNLPDSFDILINAQVMIGAVMSGLPTPLLEIKVQKISVNESDTICVLNTQYGNVIFAKESSEELGIPSQGVYIEYVERGYASTYDTFVYQIVVENTVQLDKKFIPINDIRYSGTNKAAKASRSIKSGSLLYLTRNNSGAIDFYGPDPMNISVAKGYQIYDVQFSSNGQFMLATGNNSQRGWLFSVSETSIDLICNLSSLVSGMITHFRISPNNDIVVIGGVFDGVPRVYSLSNNGLELRSYVEGNGSSSATARKVTHIEFSSDGKMLAIIYGSFMQLYSVSGESTTFLNNVNEGLTIHDCKFTKDGKYAFVAFAGALKMYSVSDSGLTYLSDVYADVSNNSFDGSVATLAISPDSSMLFVGGEFTGHAKIYSISDNTCTYISDLKADVLGRPIQMSTGTISSASFSNDGKCLVIGSSWKLSREYGAKVYSISDTTVSYYSELKCGYNSGNNNYVKGFSFHPTYNMLAVAGNLYEGVEIFTPAYTAYPALGEPPVGEYYVGHTNNDIASGDTGEVTIISTGVAQDFASSVQPLVVTANLADDGVTLTNISHTAEEIASANTSGANVIITVDGGISVGLSSIESLDMTEYGMGVYHHIFFEGYTGLAPKATHYLINICNDLDTGDTVGELNTVWYMEDVQATNSNYIMGFDVYGRPTAVSLEDARTKLNVYSSAEVDAAIAAAIGDAIGGSY